MAYAAACGVRAPSLSLCCILTSHPPPPDRKPEEYIKKATNRSVYGGKQFAGAPPREGMTGAATNDVYFEKKHNWISDVRVMCLPEAAEAHKIHPPTHPPTATTMNHLRHLRLTKPTTLSYLMYLRGPYNLPTCSPTHLHS